jgi:ATP-binding cassette subfamily B protein
MKFPICTQKNIKFSSAACVKMITDYHGQSFSIEEIKQRYISDQASDSLSSIVQAFDKLGYNAIGNRVTIESLVDKVAFPYLIFWDKKYFVILYNIKVKNNDTIFYVADPLLGLTNYSKDEFIKHWHTTRFGSENKGSILLIDAM